MKALRKAVVEVSVMLPVGFALGTLLDVGLKAIGIR
jgi:hypothetical protein